MLMKLRENPDCGYEAEHSPVTVENPFLSPGSAESTCPCGATTLGHSERLRGEKMGGKVFYLVISKCMILLKKSQSKPRPGQVPKCMTENNLVQLTQTCRIHLLCPIYTSAVLFHGLSEGGHLTPQLSPHPPTKTGHFLMISAEHGL